MVKGLLYKWEDSPALHHHCGVCARPLKHPIAKKTCFGVHAEPCARYHQAMFMPGRGHTCIYCIQIDEAHHTRHQKLTEQLRDIYEAAGEANWTIESQARGKCKSSNPSSQLATTPDSNPACTSKRQRKDAKCLARAASRCKFITLDEVNHVGKVIHAATHTSTQAAEAAGPNNAQDMQEIERHLAYNANVYHMHRTSKDMKKPAAKLADDVDINFATEVQRALEMLGITQLAKTHGLQGKKLKRFEALVRDVEGGIVEDLVRDKMDEVEMRMRRAGFLRYINKARFVMLQERYSERDWRTGEKYTCSSSSSSSPVPSDAGTESLDEEDGLREVLDEVPVLEQEVERDQRHLEKAHRRIDRDGRNGGEENDASLLPLPMATSRKQRRRLLVHVEG